MNPTENAAIRRTHGLIAQGAAGLAGGAYGLILGLFVGEMAWQALVGRG